MAGTEGDAASADKKYLHTIAGQHEQDGILYLPSTPADHQDVIRNLEYLDEDVMVASFSKSGTTWTQEVLYLIHNGADIEEAGSRPITERVPFIDYNKMLPRVTSKSPPRLFKSHLQPQFFKSGLDSGKLKAVVMMRNPKDTLVSFYHFYQVNRAFGCFTGTWSEFFEIVKQKQLIYGDWFDYTLEWWGLRDRPNVLILKYEEMKANPVENVRRVAEFCGKDLTDEQVQRIVEHTSFNKMKDNPSVSYSNRTDFMKKGSSFMRKGSTGGWTNYFTVAQNRWFDEQYAEKLAGTGLDFVFEME